MAAHPHPWRSEPDAVDALASSLRALIEAVVEQSAACAEPNSELAVSLLYDSRRAAERAGISRSSLYARTKAGELPSVIVDGRRLWRETDLAEWAKRLDIAPPPARENT